MNDTKFEIEQSKQRGLIDHRASQEHLTVLFQIYGQALKPVCPLMIQMTFDPDLLNR